MKFFKQNWFLLLALFALTVMTLVPKLPLFEIIPGYIVRARLEDILMALMLVVFAVQLIRKKASLKSPLTPIFVFYFVVGILSMLSAMFIVKSLPLNLLHVGKMFLHFARRIEYFSIFYIFYASVKRAKDIRLVYLFLVIMMLGITIYGFGQKYFYWPVYSTMNREFSKGMRLVLTDHARVPSTFAGHYDMAAFDMAALTLLLSAIFFVEHKGLKLGLIVVYASGFWLLILASSRSSFLAYLLSTGTLILFIGVYKKSVFWTLSRGLVVMSLSLFVMISFGDLSSRFTQLGIVKQVQTVFGGLLKPVGSKPSGAFSVDPLDKTDQLPVGAK